MKKRLVLLAVLFGLLLLSSVSAEKNCNDGRDNDDDGNIDYPDDSGCENDDDDSEDSGCSENYDDENYPGRNDNCDQWYDYYHPGDSDDLPTVNLFFKLSDFSNSDVTTILGVDKFDSIKTEDDNHWEALKGVDNGLYAFTNEERSYIDFSTNGNIIPQSVSFDDDKDLRPSTWIVVRAKVRVGSGYTNNDMTIVSKQTESAGDPLYSLGTSDGEYKFVLSLGSDSTKVKLTGGKVTANDWVDLVGIYTGDWVYFYVDGENVADAGYSSDIHSENDGRRLALGYSTVSDDYPFLGLLDDVYIWGSDYENKYVSSDEGSDEGTGEVAEGINIEEEVSSTSSDCDCDCDANKLVVSGGLFQAAEYGPSSYLPWIIGAVGVLLIGGILYWHFKPSSPVKKGKRK